MQQTILFKVLGKPSTSPILSRCLYLLFSEKVSIIVLVAAALLTWWHLLTTDSTLTAQRAAGLDALLLTPWLIVWAVRSLTQSRKGGEL